MGQQVEQHKNDIHYIQWDLTRLCIHNYRSFKRGNYVFISDSNCMGCFYMTTR